MSFSFKNMAYLASIIPAILVIAGNLQGNWWTLLGGGFLLSLAIPDWLFKSKTQIDPENETIPDLLLAFQVFLQTLTLVTLLYGINYGILSGIWIWSAAISTGMVSGSAALVVSHELIHRMDKPLKYMGIWLLFLNNYTHYTIEHIQGHHRFVGMGNDPTTAHYNENFYQFLARIIPEQYMTALHIEARRLKMKNQNPYGLRNFVVNSTLLKIVFLGILWYAFGTIALLAWLLQSIIARFGYETGSYVQHYGLTRNDSERIAQEHAWQSNSVISRLFLFEIGRHSDHHCHVTRPFEALESCQTSPELPAGSFGLFGPVLIPPLWFKIINTRLTTWHEHNAQAKK